MDISPESLASAINSVIDLYQKSLGVDLSIQQIADRTKSSYTTISEIRKNKIKSFTVKKALEISESLNGPDTLAELLNQDLEVIEYQKRFSHLFNHTSYEGEKEKFFHDQSFAKIIWAAFGNGNITKNEIRNRWGYEGLEKTEYLIKTGLLIEEDNLIKGSSSSASFGLKSVHKQLMMASKLYNQDRSIDELNWISFQTNSVNYKFIKLIRGELKTLFDKFYKLSCKDEYIGDTRIFMGLILDQYLEELSINNYDNKGKLQ